MRGSALHVNKKMTFCINFDEIKTRQSVKCKAWFIASVFYFLLNFQVAFSHPAPYYRFGTYRNERNMLQPVNWEDEVYQQQIMLRRRIRALAEYQESSMIQNGNAFLKNQDVLRRRIREVGNAQEPSIINNEDPQCSAKSSVAEQALEGSIHKARRFDMIPIADDRLNMVDLRRGFLMGLHSLTPHHPIDISCGGKEVVIRTTLTIAHARMFYDWSAPAYKYVGTAWAFADDVQLDMTALILDSSVSFPAVHIIEMKVQNMKNFRSGNEGPDIFALFGDVNRITLLKSIMTKALEHLLKEVLWKNLQTIISQTWHNTNSKSPLQDKKRNHIMYRSDTDANVSLSELLEKANLTGIHLQNQTNGSSLRNKTLALHNKHKDYKHNKVKAYLEKNLMKRPIKPKTVNVKHGVGLFYRDLSSDAGAKADGGKDGIGLTQSQSGADKDKSDSQAQGVAANPSGSTAVSQSDGQANKKGTSGMSQNIDQSPDKGVTISQTRTQGNKKGKTSSDSSVQNIKPGQTNFSPNLQLSDEETPEGYESGGYPDPSSAYNYAPPYIPAHCCMMPNPAYGGGGGGYGGREYGGGMTGSRSSSSAKSRRKSKSRARPPKFRSLEDMEYRALEKPKYGMGTVMIPYRSRDFLEEPQYRTEYDPYASDFDDHEYYRSARGPLDYWY